MTGYFHAAVEDVPTEFLVGKRLNVAGDQVLFNEHQRGLLDPDLIVVSFVITGTKLVEWLNNPINGWVAPPTEEEIEAERMSVISDRIDMVNASVDAKRLEYGADIAYQSQTYLLKEEQARGWKNKQYAGEVPALVKAVSDRFGLDWIAAANIIIEKGALFREVLKYTEQEREIAIAAAQADDLEAFEAALQRIKEV